MMPVEAVISGRAARIDPGESASGRAAFLTAASAAVLLFSAGDATGQEGASGASYPAMAPVEEYRMKSRDDEIALARSAAPRSVSNAAEILTLGAREYETAVEGDNGFVCIVERSWANDFDHPEFWNPKIRAPLCFNPAAARSVLPTYLRRTKRVLAGESLEHIQGRARADLAADGVTAPEPGAMCYMMSKEGYLSDESPNGWQPHLMFFLPRTPLEEWGANSPGSPVLAAPGGLEPLTVFLSVVPYWSDGTPAP